MVSGEVVAQQTWVGSSKSTGLSLPKPVQDAYCTCTTYFNSGDTSKSYITADGILRFQNGVSGSIYGIGFTYLTAD